MKLKYLIPAIFLFAAPALALAAPLEYESFSEIRAGEPVVELRGLKVPGAPPRLFLCDGELKACGETASSSFPAVGKLVGNEDYFASKDGKRALAARETAPGVRVYTLWNLTREAAQPVADIAWPFALRTALFADNGKVILVGGGQVGVYDGQNGLTDIFSKDLRNASFFAVSPDGNFLAYYYDAPKGGERRHAVLSLRSRREYKLSATLKYWDLLSEYSRIFDWSPDGATLYFLDDRGGYPAIYRARVADMANGRMKSEALISRSYSVADFVAGDGELYVLANRENPLEWNLYAYSLASGGMKLLARNVSYGNALRHIGGGVFFFEMRGNSKVLVRYDIATGILKDAPIALSPHPESGTRTVFKTGKTYSALWLPGNITTSTPLIVWLHGGPFRQTSLGFHPYGSYSGYDEVLETLRRQGIMVLRVDYPGSFGYGRAWAESLLKNVGKKDVAAVREAAGAVKKKYGVKDAYLMGNSYGGYLALRTLVAAPDEFRGAVSINGVTDWKRLLLDLRTSIFNVQFGGAPKKSNAALYATASITSRLPRLTPDNKIILIYGEEDDTIPNSESLALYADLLGAGKNADLVNYPREGHAIEEKEHLADICSRVLKLTGGGEGCVLE